MPHYSSVQRPAKIAQWADHAARQLIAFYHGGQAKHPVLVYRGLSGTGAAHAVMLALYRFNPEFLVGMAYVRKPDERSHGREIEFEDQDASALTQWEAVFVDDFISSGATKAAAKMAVATHDTLCNAPWANFDLMSGWRGNGE